MNADEIIVLRRGVIVERGTHSELVRRNGVYAEMWDQQKKEAEQDPLPQLPTEASSNGTDGATPNEIPTSGTVPVSSAAD